MREYLRKAVMVLLVLGATFLFSISTYAATENSKVTFLDTYLLFDIWQGSGTVSVNIGDDFLTTDNDIVNFGEFEELRCDGITFDNSNYEVTKKENNTIITLKEEYLKTLKDGTYAFDAVFSRAIIPIRLHIITHKISLTDAYFVFDTWTGKGSSQVNLNPTTYSIAFYPELFNGLFYKEAKVDNSNYIISKFANVTRIILKEEYIKTLPGGEHYFVADFMNVSVKLKLQVNKIKITTIRHPKRVKNVKITAKKKRLTVRWKKQKNITGYRIKIGTNKKFTKNKKVITIKKNKNKVTIKGLKANKKYYVMVKAYKTVNGKKYWGTWSKKVSKVTK